MSTNPDEFLAIDTPENVIFGYEIAGIGSRFMAALVDTLIIVVIQGVVIFVFVLALGSIIGSNPALEEDPIVAWILGAMTLFSFVVLWGYYILFEMLWNGQSPGKRLMNLRVIRKDGTPITLTESIIRNLVRLIDLLPSTYGVGVISMFFSEQARRLGDMAAGTLVVFDQPQVSLESLRTKPTTTTATVPRPAYQPISEPGTAPDVEAAPIPPAPTFPVERLTETDSQLVEEYLRRRFELANTVDMALKIAERVRQRMELPPQQFKNHAALSAWLAEVLGAYRERAR